MFLVCLLPDVCIIFASTADVLYIILVGAGDIIVYSTAIIFSTGSIMIPILVGDLFLIGRMFLFCSIGISLMITFVLMTDILIYYFCV